MIKNLLRARVSMSLPMFVLMLTICATMTMVGSAIALPGSDASCYQYSVDCPPPAPPDHLAETGLLILPIVGVAVFALVAGLYLRRSTRGES